MILCQYGCNRQAYYSPKKGMKKWCCKEHYNKCPAQIQEKVKKFKPKLKGKVPWNKGKKGLQVAWNKGLKFSNESKKKMSISSRLTISKIKKKYPLFFKIEEMRYNPYKPGEKEIQVHCKNHNCKNSKEKGGWFTPTGIQLYERIRQLENENGNGGSYLYCSDECKNECPLYRIYDDPFKNKIKPYTPSEYIEWKNIILEKDNNECQYCGKKENLNVHHIKPEKLFPHLSLDIDNGITLCRVCHIKIGHNISDECKLKNIKKVCKPIMGNFLN